METEGEFVFATSLDSKDMDQIAEFLEQSVRGEGARAAARCGLACLLPTAPWTVCPEPACSGRCGPGLPTGLTSGLLQIPARGSW